jgi:hypothetical protein
MLCDHQLVIDHINDFIEDKLSVELKQQVSSCIEQCEDCQTTYRQCLQLYQMSHEWQQQEVPEWHRTRYAVRPPVKQNSWLNWASMATSSLAILMVVFQLEVNTGDQGLTISFGGNQAESKIENMVEQQLASYKKTHEKLFEVKLKTALEQQDNRTKLRLANWIEKNRDERQQDIKFVMTGWQSQRYEDLKNVDQRFAYLADNQIENNQAINQLIQSVGDDGSEQQPNDM